MDLDGHDTEGCFGAARVGALETRTKAVRRKEPRLLLTRANPLAQYSSGTARGNNKIDQEETNGIRTQSPPPKKHMVRGGTRSAYEEVDGGTCLGRHLGGRAGHEFGLKNEATEFSEVDVWVLG